MDCNPGAMRRVISLLAAFGLVLVLALLTTAAEAKQEARVNLNINGQQFAVTLADNDTARAFAALMPMRLKMSDLHGNEKYHYLGTSLPSRPENPGRIHAGDLMLFGDDCVVLFYKDFNTSYSYTRIGRVTNAAGLAAAVGRGAITAEFGLGATERNDALKGGAVRSIRKESGPVRYSPPRIRITSRLGGAPNMRLYSRANWVALA